MAILIDPKGLLEGKRLRALSYMARLYYPYILGLTNFYARVENDPDVIVSKLSLVNDPTLSDNVSVYIDQYIKANLCLSYEHEDGTHWLQFDTKVSLRSLHPTTEDNRSPVPPEYEYIAWLKGLHKGLWEEYDISTYQKTISEKRAEAGRAGGKASGKARSKTNGAERFEPVVDNSSSSSRMKDERVEEEVIDNAIIALSHDVSRMESASPSESLSKDLSKTSNDKNPAAWYDVLTALDWAHTYRTILSENPKFDPAAIGAKWESKWEEQFTAALADYTPVELANLMAVSQTARCKDSCFTVDYLLRKVDKRTGQPTTLREIVESLRKKNLLSATRADFKKKLDRLSQPQTPAVDFIDIPDFEYPELD